MVALGAVSALILAIVFVIVSISGNGSTPREGALPSASTALKAQGNSRTAPVAANSGGPKTSFGDGIHVVGTDIAPGTYSTGGGKGCYWELDTSLDGSTSAIAKDGTPAGSDTVRITNADKAFLTAGCGTWTLAN
jgi:hypothetical protein